MYLAGILALCALLHAPIPGGMRSAPSPLAIADAHSIRQSASTQEPSKPDSSSEAAPDQAKPTQPQQEAVPAQENTQSPPSSAPPANAAPENKSPAQPGAKPPTAHKSTRKKRPAPALGEEQQRKVVRQGSTQDPVTQLAPGITGEQAARQREVTNQLLAQTDASLQKLSGRSLSKDQQDTVAQIRKFMEQVKAAQAAGDLQRAYKLAVKAHLLADALEKS
jgi:hypothetical protein